MDTGNPTFYIDYFDGSRSELFHDVCDATEAGRKQIDAGRHPRPRAIIRVEDNAKIASYSRSTERSQQKRSIPADDVGEVTTKSSWDVDPWE